jgi:hypothetical protein
LARARPLSFRRQENAMKIISWVAAIALVPLVAVAASAQSSPAPGTVTVPITAQNGSGESGTATLVQSGSDVTVTLTLNNSGSDPQPAHIHPGTCANLNPVPVYPLSNVVNGTSVSTVKGVTVASLQTGAFAINVHKSTSDLKTYVACGDIPKMAMPGSGSM